jgi:glycerophosphoryl diester phosphodiesterase
MLLAFFLASTVVIAHRGDSWDAPEETAPAYANARDMGADYLEMDIQRTRDGALIALHDTSLLRTTDVAAVFPSRKDSGPESFTLAELKKLDAGSWWNAAHPERANAKYAGLRVLTLDEVIDLAPHAKLYIETKSPERYPGIERDLVALLARRGALDRVMFQSFSLQSLKTLAVLAPQVPRVLLLDEDASDADLDAAVDVHAAGIGPKGTWAWKWNVDKAHARGLFVHAWTVDQEWQMWLLDVMGVDGVFTDRPDVALERGHEEGGRGGPPH